MPDTGAMWAEGGGRTLLLLLRVLSAALERRYHDDRAPGRRLPPVQMKLTMPVPQPTPWIQTVWMPWISGARSLSETIIFAVNDS
jgi:hypothetical protein